MKTILIVLFLWSGHCYGQAMPVRDSVPHGFKGFQPYSITATLAVGMGDWYRQHYTMPSGYEKQSVTGIAPLTAIVEYAACTHLGLAVHGYYDNFISNYAHLIQSHGGTERRNGSDMVSAYGGGADICYHFTSLVPIAALDISLSLGGTINNITHHGYPQSDTTVMTVAHTVTPSARLNLRYYLNSSAAVFASAGYDRISLVQAGFSCLLVTHRRL